VKASLKPASRAACWTLRSWAPNGYASVVHGTDGRSHVSGHGSQEELLLMLNLVRPEFFVPVHGECHRRIHHFCNGRTVIRDSFHFSRGSQVNPRIAATRPIAPQSRTTPIDPGSALLPRQRLIREPRALRLHALVRARED